MARAAGTERARALTQTPEASEWHPSWSADGTLAFLSDRGGEDAKTQVWIMPAAGGKARQITEFADGVEDFALSPDGQRLAVIAWDPERPEGAQKPKNPPPIVIKRYQFKEDGVGYLTDRRKHLYVVDVASGKATLLTSGDHDEQLPAWSPDGRDDRLCHQARGRSGPPPQLRHLPDRAGSGSEGAAADQLPWVRPRSLLGIAPVVEPGRQDRSPISRAARTSGSTMPHGNSPSSMSPVASRQLPSPIDMSFTKPRWSPDGRSVLSLVERNRVTHLSRIDVDSGKVTALTSGARFDTDFAIAPNGRIAVLGGGRSSAQ